MSLHPLVVTDMLVAEADVARDRLGDRVSAITVDVDHVDVTFNAHGRHWHLRLAGPEYDRLPLSVSFIDEDGNVLDAGGWPPGLAYQGEHPVVKRAWVCLRGTYEYHLYPGHTAGGDSWDVNRGDHRLDDVISHILERCGQ